MVCEGITVSVIPDQNHEFLMTTREVALGYDVSPYTIRRHSMEHSSELHEGKHFIKGVQKCHTLAKGVQKTHTLANAQPHQVFWTKRGIVRLGFFIKSQRAKLFRDWAEELILRIEAQRDLFGEVQVPVSIDRPKSRNHNRLTHHRLLSIMSDVCRIEDKDLRLSLSGKLMAGSGVN